MVTVRQATGKKISVDDKGEDRVRNREMCKILEVMGKHK